MIKNIYDCEVQQIKAHDGNNQINLARVLDQKGDQTTIQFMDYVTIPQGSSIGSHKHHDLEEIYILLSGDGIILLDGVESRVKPGDVIQIRGGTSHELRNEQGPEIQLIVCAATTKGKD